MAGDLAVIQTAFLFNCFLGRHRTIPEKKTWEGKTAGDVFFYGWLVRKVFKLYGSVVSKKREALSNLAKRKRRA